jgi:anaerobic selenocysteine-containing dehydrogenase
VREPAVFSAQLGARTPVENRDGKANSRPCRAAPHLKPDEFMMMTMRSHDQYNTQFMADDRYRGIYNERRVVLLNAEDIREAGLAAGQVVDLTSHFEGQQREAKKFIVVEYSIPRRCAATYFPEANVLVPSAAWPRKATPPLRSRLSSPCARLRVLQAIIRRRKSAPHLLLFQL